MLLRLDALKHRHGLLLLALLLLGDNFSANAISLAQWCDEIGGYFVPAEMTFQKKGEGECRCLEQLGGMPRHATPPNDRCRALTEERLCSSPAKFICQSEQANDFAKNQNAYFEAVQQAKRRVAQLDKPERSAFTRRVNQELDALYYQKNNRRQRVDDAFNRAKKTMLSMLEARKKRYPDQARDIDAMMETLRRVTYVVGWTEPTADGLLPHNMAALTTDQDIYHPNKILIGTVISELDSSPEGFYFGLLHEFSHFIDPGRYTFKPHPFSREIDCLRNPGTIGAKNAQKEGRDQINEAFADWLAMRAWISENHGSLATATVPAQYRKPIQSPDDDPNQFIQTLDTWNAKGATLKNLREINAVTCGAYRYYERVNHLTREKNPDEHPLGIDRAEALLASPEIKKALGCSDKYIFKLKEPKQSVPPGLTAYCGDDLYEAKAPLVRPRIERLPAVLDRHRK